jgi:hypothetical protein
MTNDKEVIAMLRKWPLVLLVLVAFGFALYGCDSTASQRTETLPTQTPATLPSNSSSPVERSQQISGKPIWKGNSGGFEIVWTEEDFFFRREKVETIFHSLADRGYDEFIADLTKNKNKANVDQQCDYRGDFAVLSIIGPLLNFEDNEYSDCGGAHPSTELRFTLVDMCRPGQVEYRYDLDFLDADLQSPGKIAKLTDYFSEADVLIALLANRVIKETLAEAGASAAPQTLAELLEVLARADYALNGTEVVLRPDFLTRFAFAHVEGERVAVRLNLPSVAVADRSKQVTLLLPIPPELKQPLALAARGEEGFLMDNAPASTRKRFTRLGFKTRP